MSYLNQTLLRNPWRIGMSGGGVPVKTGNLRDTHRRTMTKMGFTIQPTANYAQHVHKKRPWLVYAATKNEKKVEKAAKEMLDAIARSLTK
ncbi:MAG: hypothetical protein Q8Q08_12820 [Candidatus Omnitrophota bacterium]|nr:hypothetical protein [Candidatus Omnitrophota bacterium]